MTAREILINKLDGFIANKFGVRVFRINHERTCNKELCFNTMSLNSTELELKELPRFELKEKK